MFVYLGLWNQIIKSYRSIGAVGMDTAQDEERQNLWKKSEPTQSFDLFLSHTWHAHGNWKAGNQVVSWTVVAMVNRGGPGCVDDFGIKYGKTQLVG